MELKKALNGIDRKNKKLYSTLTEKEKKDFSPWLLMRYTSNIKEGPWRLFYHHLVMTNEFVNVHFSDLRKHKELQWLLLQLVGTGKNFFHEFISPGKKSKKNKIKLWLMEVLPTTKERDIDTLIELNTNTSIKDYAKQHGISDKQIKKIFS